MSNNPRPNAPKSNSDADIANAKNEFSIIEGEPVPIEIPNVRTVLLKFRSLKTRRRSQLPGSAAIVLGVGPLKPLQWLFYHPESGFFSVVSGEPSEPPERFLQITGSKTSSKSSARQHTLPILHDLLAHMPSALLENSRYETPYHGSIILSIKCNPRVLLLDLMWVDDNGGFWEILNRTAAKAPLYYIQLSAGDSGIDPRTFPLQTDCRSKATKKSDLTIVL